MTVTNTYRLHAYEGADAFAQTVQTVGGSVAECIKEAMEQLRAGTLEFDPQYDALQVAFMLGSCSCVRCSVE